MDFRCLRRLLNISYKDRISNKEVRNRVFMIIGNHKLPIIWITISMSKIFLQGTVNSTRNIGRPRLKLSDNIYEWTGLNVCDAMRAATDRKKWRTIVSDSSAPLRLNATG